MHFYKVLATSRLPGLYWILTKWDDASNVYSVMGYMEFFWVHGFGVGLIVRHFVYTPERSTLSMK